MLDLGFKLFSGSNFLQQGEIVIHWEPQKYIFQTWLLEIKLKDLYSSYLFD